MKKTYDIVMFNINGYLKYSYVFDIFQKNLEHFEKYQENHKDLEFRWHTIDNEKLKEIAENFNLRYTKRCANKGVFKTEEVKFFLSTQFDRYLTFPADMMMSEKDIDNIFNNDDNLIVYYKDSLNTAEFNINENHVIKTEDKNNVLAQKILHFFNRTFQGPVSTLNFFSAHISEIDISEFKEDSLLDFKLFKPTSPYISFSMLKKTCKDRFEKNDYGFNKVYFCDDAFSALFEKKLGFTFHIINPELVRHVLNDSEEAKLNWSYYIFDSGIYINRDKLLNFFGFNSLLELNLKFNNYISEITGERAIDITGEAALGIFRLYLKDIYETTGIKTNIYNILEWDSPSYNFLDWGNFYSDYCYEAKDRPDELVPLPYLDLDKAVKKMCW